MLQNIREHAQGWIAWVIVGLLVLAFSFWGVEHFFTGNGGAKNVVATVNGHEITQNEINVTYERLRRQQQLQEGENFTFTLNAEKALKQKALDQLIQNYVSIKSSLEAGFRVSPPQIDAVLANIPVFQEKGQFSAPRYLAVLNNMSYSQDAFRQQLWIDMMNYQSQIGLLASAFALPSEIRNAYRLFNQRRDFSYLVIPKKNFLNQNVSEAELSNYYQKHQQEFYIPETVSLQFLELNLQDIKSRLKFSEADLKKYYFENKNNFSTAPQWQVAQILIKAPAEATPEELKTAEAKTNEVSQKLKAGADFSKLAETYSDDITTAKKGGVLSWFSSGMIDPTFEKTAKELKVGEVSNPVRTSYGFNIIKLLGMKQSEPKSFEEVKSQIEALLAQEKAQTLFSAQVDQLTNLTYTNSESLKPAADALQLAIKTTEPFGRQGTKNDLTANPKVLEAAFSPDVINQNYNSNTIEITPERVIVLRIKEHNPAAVKPFQTVKTEITTKLQTQYAAEKTKTLGEKIIQNMQAGQNTNLSEAKLEWQQAKNIGRYNSAINPIIINEAFTLGRPKEDGKPIIGGIKLPTGDYAIVQLQKIADGDLSQMSKTQLQAFQNQLANSYGQLDYRLYTDEKMQKAKIKMLKDLPPATTTPDEV